MFPVVWGSQISRQSAHEGGKVVSLMHRSPLPPRKYSWYSFLLEAESPQSHSAARRIVSMKNSNETFGNWTRDLPACSQCLNRLRHRVPPPPLTKPNVYYFHKTLPLTLTQVHINPAQNLMFYSLMFFLVLYFLKVGISARSSTQHCQRTNIPVL